MVFSDEFLHFLKINFFILHQNYLVALRCDFLKFTSFMYLKIIHLCMFCQTGRRLEYWKIAKELIFTIHFITPHGQMYIQHFMHLMANCLGDVVTSHNGLCIEDCRIQCMNHRTSYNELFALMALQITFYTLPLNEIHYWNAHYAAKSRLQHFVCKYTYTLMHKWHNLITRIMQMMQSIHKGD